METERSFLEIIEEYVEADRVTLPPFDKTAMRIQHEIRKPDVQISSIEKLIISDPAMASQVLKVANSAFFRGLAKVGTIKEAIVRLGLDEITRIVLVLSQKKLYQTQDSFIKNYRSRLWQHAIVSALVSQWVAKEAGYEELNQEAFFASLVHDIGKLFLITVMEQIKKSKDIPFIPSNSIINDIVRSQHAEQGYRLLKRWNLPETYWSVVRDHHNNTFDTENVPLIILRLVNKVCCKVGVSLEKYNDAAMSISAESAFFGFSEIKIAELELQVEDAVKWVRSHYKISIPTA